VPNVIFLTPKYKYPSFSPKIFHPKKWQKNRGNAMLAIGEK
jgi:hypothetical protein